MTPDHESRRDLALLVSDGESPDWDEHIDEAEGDDATDEIAGMRVLSRIAEFHRGSSRRWGQLTLLESLGKGSYGTVYRARDTRLDREVALKLLDTTSVADDRKVDLLHEARLLARVRHPNVVTVYGADEHDGTVGIWMDLLRGTTLQDRIRNDGVLSPREAALIGADLCRALAAVHETGVVHGDVKAANVMQDAGGHWVLADFGAGRLAAGGSDERVSVSGTPLYMAPEVLRGDPGTARSDLYALGVLLYHLVTGSFPIDAKSMEELKRAHEEGHRALLRDARADLPDGFVRVVEKALRGDPSDRFRTAGEMEAALAAWLSEGAAPRDPDASGRTRGLWVAVAATVLVIGAWFALRPGATPLTFEATLVRVSANGVRTPLEPGDRVSPGDRVAMEIRADRDTWVYVVNEDEAGHAFVLFPLPGLDVGNPLPAGSRHTLPGTVAGAERYWTADTAGGREHFLVVASSERREGFERELLALARPEMVRDRPMALDDDARRELIRGFGALTGRPDDAAGASAGRLFEMADELVRHAEATEGVRVRHIVLENPIP